MDQIGTCSFELPMALRQNYGLGIGTMARVTDTTWGVQGTYVVGDKSETVSADGHWSQFALADLLEELRWGEIPGFIAEDLALEPTARTAQRLLDIANLAQPAYPWQAVYTGIDYFAGTPFQIEGTTPFQAIAKLASDRFLHFRRNPAAGGGQERTLEIGTFPTNASGIRLVRSSARPAAMARDYIRPIPEGGLTRKNDAAAIVNVIAPTGNGAGFAQLTLQPLWNPATVQRDTVLNYDYCILTPFAGMNAQYNKLYRRIRYDGGGLDGYEYFLVDQPSVDAYRQRWLRYPRTDIGTVSQATLDLSAAAENLHIVAVAYLQGHARPNEVLSVTTIGRGSVTGLAASTVDVSYAMTENAQRTLDVNGPYYVLGVERSVNDADGTMTDAWNVSSLGQYAQSNASVITGLSQAIDSLRLGGTMFPSRGSIYQDSPVDAYNRVTVTVDVDPGVIAVVQCLFTVSLLPLISPINGGVVVPHTHNVTIPSVSVDASVPRIGEQSSNAYGQFGHNHTYNNPYGQANYGHSAPYGQANYGHSAPRGQANYGHSAPYGQANYGHGAPGGQAAYGHAADGGQFNHSQGVSASDTSHGHSSYDQGGHTQGVSASETGHGHGDSISANKSGTSANATNVAHVHYIQVGSSGGSPVNQTLHYIAQGDNSFLEVQGGSGGSFHTNGYYGSGGVGDPNHSHSDSINVSKGGGVNAINPFGGASNAYNGFTPNVNNAGMFPGGSNYFPGATPYMYNHPGFQPSVDQHNGFSPSVDQHNGFSPSVDQHNGFSPSVDQHNGFRPDIRGDDPGGFQPNTTFPGYGNTRTQAQTVQTSGTQSDSTFRVQYGIYKDPVGAPTGVTITVNGAQVAGPFSASFTADLTAAVAAQVSRGQPVDVVFRSASLGRLIIRGKVRYRESVVKVT